VGQIRRYERDKSFCGPTSLSCFRRHLWGGGWAKTLTPTHTDVCENMTGWWGHSETR
jgi:hypothetical protein